MRILIIGGTSFVGRHITTQAVAQGHEVTLFNRGLTNPGAFATEQITGDRNAGSAGLAGLEGKSYDATIDVCAYVPARVEELLGVLGDGAGHYTFISTISVYPDDTPTRFTEAAALRAPSYATELTMDAYGALKVGCEVKASELAPAGLLVVRPGYVVGPFDPTGRFTYWVERVAAAKGGAMLGPDADQPFQGIDGRDLAAFVVHLVEKAATGAFNGTGPDPAVSFSSLIGLIAQGLAVPLPKVRWTSQHDKMPLSEVPESWGLMDADLSKSLAHGLTLRSLQSTSADLYEWVTKTRSEGNYHDRGGSLTPAEESELLAGW